MGLYWDTHIISTIYIYIIWHGYMWNYKCNHIKYTIYYTDIICPFRMTHFHSFPSFVAQQKHRQNVTPPGQRATLPMFQRTPSGLTTLLAAKNWRPGLLRAAVNIREPWGLLSTKSVFSDRPGWLISSVGHSQGLCWGLGDGKSVLSTCKKAVHEKIWKNKVCSGSIDSKKKFGRGLPRNDLFKVFMKD